MPAPDVSALERDIAIERARFLASRTQLGRVLYGKAVDGAQDQILEYAEEYGVAEAVTRLGADPQHFGVKVDAATVAQVHPQLFSLLETTHKLDGLVRQREDILCKADPSRKRVYMFYGREFTMDPDKQTMTFLDAPDHPEPLQIVEGKPLRPAAHAKDEIDDDKNDQPSR
jgi:hypothetical protein